MSKHRIPMVLTDAARSRVENAEKPSFFFRMGPLGQEFGINGKLVSKEEYCQALRPWNLPPMCHKSVFEKKTKRFLGCILSSLDKEAGRFSTKGEIGYIDVDPEIHCTRLATADEMKRVFKPGFYDDLHEVAGVHISKFHKF